MVSRAPISGRSTIIARPMATARQTSTPTASRGCCRLRVGEDVFENLRVHLHPRQERRQRRRLDVEQARRRSADEDKVVGDRLGRRGAVENLVGGNVLRRIGLGEIHPDAAVGVGADRRQAADAQPLDADVVAGLDQHRPLPRGEAQHLDAERGIEVPLHVQDHRHAADHAVGLRCDGEHPVPGGGVIDLRNVAQEAAVVFHPAGKPVAEHRHRGLGRVRRHRPVERKAGLAEDDAGMADRLGEQGVVGGQRLQLAAHGRAAGRAVPPPGFSATCGPARRTPRRSPPPPRASW